MGESWKHKEAEHSNARFSMHYHVCSPYGGTLLRKLDMYRKNKQTNKQTNKQNKRTFYKGYFTFQGFFFLL